MYRWGFDRLFSLFREGIIDRMIIVTQYDEIVRRIREDFDITSLSGFRVVRNDRPDLGISHSIRLGLDAASKMTETQKGKSAFLFAVSDQPNLSRKSLTGLIRCYEHSGKKIAACSSGRVPGNPVIFSSDYVPELRALKGDHGGKKVLLRHPEDTALFEVPSWELKDYDEKIEPSFFLPGRSEPVSAEEAFPFLKSENGIISLVGGGGKTTAMYYLAGRLAKQGKRVLVSTTTHIEKPDESILARREEDIHSLWQKGSFAVFANPEYPSDGERKSGKALPPSERYGKKLRCPDLALLRQYMNLADFTILEADGAKHMALKVPREGEPVILPETGIVIGVMGLDAIGHPVSEACFRHALAEELLHVPPDHILNETDAAAILLSDRGTRKDVRDRKYFVLLNKCDSEERRESGERIAARISGPADGIILSAFR